MDNNDIIIVSNCKNCTSQLNTLFESRKMLIEEYRKFEADGMNTIESIGIIAVFAAIVSILLLIFFGIHWVFSIILGCLIGGIFDIPFKAFRKIKHKISLNYKQKETKQRTHEIDSLISTISSNNDFLYVKSIIGDYCYDEVCLSAILDIITKDCKKSIRTAFEEYLHKIEEDKRIAEERKKAEETARKTAEAKKKREEEQKKQEEERRREEQKKQAEERQKAKHNNNDNTSNSVPDYFVGCDSLETLTKRYKQLAKCYHPDTGIGDEATMKAINSQYESLRAKFQ